MPTVINFIHAMAQRAYSITDSAHLLQGVQTVLQKREQLGNVTLKCFFFLMLNMDQVFKEYMCNSDSVQAFAAAMNLHATPLQADAQHMYNSIATRPLSAEKARRFYPALRTSVQEWMSNEILTPAFLLQRIKDEYLVA